MLIFIFIINKNLNITIMWLFPEIVFSQNIFQNYQTILLYLQSLYLLARI